MIGLQLVKNYCLIYNIIEKSKFLNIAITEKKMRSYIVLIFLFISAAAFPQKHEFKHVKDTFKFNSFTLKNIEKDFESTKDVPTQIIIDSQKGHVTVEIGKERPRHYIIDTKGVTRRMDLGIQDSYVFRLSPIYGKGDYMFVRLSWQFVVLMVEEEKSIYVFKNVM